MPDPGPDPAPSATAPGAPVVILVEPQLAENIGMAARAMANFGLSELRLVAPRDGWPRKGAHSAASGATHVLDGARLYATTREAIADLNLVLATTARERGQMKRVLLPEEALRDAHARLGAGEKVGILFGRERTGLENDDISLADAIVTFPVDPAFASVNLAQAVLLVGYEWFKIAGATAPFAGDRRTPPASREMIVSFFDYLESELEAVNFYPEDKKPTMTRNMRDIFHRMQLTEQDIRTLRGAVRALAEGRRLRKPAKCDR
jgi:tRNA/rRNA methyltransferase